jgi:hypothetical protein
VEGSFECCNELSRSINVWKFMTGCTAGELLRFRTLPIVQNSETFRKLGLLPS